MIKLECCVEEKDERWMRLRKEGLGIMEQFGGSALADLNIQEEQKK